MIKKSYKKPEIVFEHMEFNTAIASACQWQRVYTCPDLVPDTAIYDGPILEINTWGEKWVILIDEYNCDVIEECYHAPTSDAIEINLS